MTHTIIMPDLGQTTAEGKILRWLKKPGEKVSKGEHLLEVETDKVTIDVESYASGYLREVLAAEGEIVSALAPIAVVTDAAEETYESSASNPSAPAVGSGQAFAAAPSFAPAPCAPTPTPTGSVAVAPAARVRAKELGVDLSLVRGTGPGGLITRKDVEAWHTERARG